MTKYVVKTGPDRWQIDVQDGKGNFKSGWVDFFVVEAIAQVIRQIDATRDRVRIELIVRDEDEDPEDDNPFAVLKRNDKEGH